MKKAGGKKVPSSEGGNKKANSKYTFKYESEADKKIKSNKNRVNKDRDLATRAYMKKYCPFKPEISEKSKQLIRKEKIYDELYEEAKARESNKELLVRKYMEKKSREETFQPKILDTGIIKTRGKEETCDLLYRNGMKSINKKYKTSLSVNALDNECSFRPVLTEKARNLKLAPVTERLYKQPQVEEKEEPYYSFTPEITDYQVRNTDKVSTVYERLYNENSQRRAKLAQKSKMLKRMEDRQCSFHPETTNKKKSDSRHVFSRLYPELPPPIPKEERLSRKKSSEMKSQSLTAESLRNYVASNRLLNMYEQGREAVLKRNENIEHEESMAECSFKPDLSKETHQKRQKRQSQSLNEQRAPSIRND